MFGTQRLRKTLPDVTLNAGTLSWALDVKATNNERGSL